MDLFENLRARAAAASAARQFPAQPPIRLNLDLSYPHDEWTLDRATTFMMSPDRVGRGRRTIYAARGEVVFEFEDETDAREFAEAFRPT